MRNEGDKQGLYRTLKITQLGRKLYNELERLHNTSVKRSDAIVALMKKLGAIKKPPEETPAC